MRQELNLPRVVASMRMFFPYELPRLPLHKDVDFIMELHPGTSPIYMSPHRMASIELHELKVQL